MIENQHSALPKEMMPGLRKAAELTQIYVNQIEYKPPFNRESIDYWVALKLFVTDTWCIPFLNENNNLIHDYKNGFPYEYKSLGDAMQWWNRIVENYDGREHQDCNYGSCIKCIVDDERKEAEEFRKMYLKIN